MQVKNEVQTRLTAEIKVVPGWAWVLAIVGFVAAQILCNVGMARSGEISAAWLRAVLGIGAGIFVGAYLLFIGYINGDAKRRGMAPVLWTIVAILIPNALGIVLYFILRQPLRDTCPHCGNAVRTEFNFCPRCSYKLSPSCSQCQRVIGVNDVYCPYCGTSQGREAAPTHNPPQATS